MKTGLRKCENINVSEVRARKKISGRMPQIMHPRVQPSGRPGVIHASMENGHKTERIIRKWMQHAKVPVIRDMKKRSSSSLGGRNN